MKKLILWTPVLIGGAMAVYRFLPPDQRKRISQFPETMMDRMMRHMPDN